jgi:Tropinone reductase 1
MHIHTQVNNAGQAFFKAAAECTAEDYSHVMATNLESSFHLCQLAHPLLVRASISGGGSVVHISSIASYLGFPGLALYCISKGINTFASQNSWDKANENAWYALP